MFLPFPCSNFESIFVSSAKPAIAFADRAWHTHYRLGRGFLSMHEGWHVAGMILTVQIAEKMRLGVQTMTSPAAGRLC
ncbi:MAG: hypothetical protein DMG31_01215 [Acidobacteria bacterium]|nr:MAG: hypothetical protein DMG31_01215 [Acidobacteriota bacterium]